MHANGEEQYARYKVNQEARSILVRHAVNLAMLGYSFTGHTLYLYGTLRRDPTGDFRPAEVQGMLKDVSRIPMVRGVQVDVDNWTVYPSERSWVVVKRREHITGKEESTLHLREQQFVREVLDEIEREKN